jgi:hypothetical protein
MAFVGDGEGTHGITLLIATVEIGSRLVPPGFSLPDCLGALTLHHFQQVKAERIFAVLIPILLQGFAAMALVSQVTQMGGKTADLPLLTRFAPSHNGHTDVKSVILSTMDGINQPQICSMFEVVNPVLK